MCDSRWRYGVFFGKCVNTSLYYTWYVLIKIHFSLTQGSDSVNSSHFLTNNSQHKFISIDCIVDLLPFTLPEVFWWTPDHLKIPRSKKNLRSSFNAVLLIKVYDWRCRCGITTVQIYAHKLGYCLRRELGCKQDKIGIQKLFLWNTQQHSKVSAILTFFCYNYFALVVRNVW